MNDCLVTVLERDVFDSIDNDAIMQQVQNMKSRQGSVILYAISYFVKTLILIHQSLSFFNKYMKNIPGAATVLEG